MDLYWKNKYSFLIKDIQKKENCKVCPNFELNLIRMCINIYNSLGSSLAEKCYQIALHYELSLFYPEYNVKYEEDILIKYENIMITTRRMDLSIYDSQRRLICIIELKSTSNNIESGQLANYMKITGCRLGYLINFRKTSEHPPESIRGIKIKNIVGQTTFKKIDNSSLEITRFVHNIKDFI